MESEYAKQRKLNEWISRFGLHFLIAIGEYIELLGNTLAAVLWRPPKLRLIMKQLYSIGVGSLNVVAITGFFTGMVLAAQSFYQLGSKGLSGITGLMVAKAMMTELGPVLTAFMVTGRVGAAMCAELGSMRVTEQIDALKTLAVNPNRYLVSPRLIAGMTMMPLLTLFSTVMGVFGGYLIAVYFFGMSSSSFFDPMPLHINTFDLFIGLSKAFFFGLLIMTIACYKGMSTTGGAEGVGRTTTSSVVITYCCILFSNFFLTLFLNTFHRQIEKLFA
ncbi:MAG: putative phospholipid ABC transporter permease protein MlaE [Chlamydiae bacterium]|nr:putative phospholipid ABC transporter permease protein MlaE [Chlamydiota bacterium]